MDSKQENEIKDITSPIEQEYRSYGFFLAQGTRDALFKKIKNSKIPIAFILVGIHHLNGAENILISHMALLDAIINIIQLHPEFAYKISITTIPLSKSESPALPDIITKRLDTIKSLQVSVASISDINAISLPGCEIIITGISTKDGVPSVAESLSIKHPEMILILDPFIHYLIEPGMNYDEMRAKATQLYKENKIMYFEDDCFRSNPELIDGYNEALHFYSNSNLLAFITLLADLKHVKEINNDEDYVLIHSILRHNHLNGLEFIAAKPKTITDRKHDYGIKCLQDSKRFYDKYKGNNYIFLVDTYRDLLCFEFHQHSNELQPYPKPNFNYSFTTAGIILKTKLEAHINKQIDLASTVPDRGVTLEKQYSEIKSTLIEELKTQLKGIVNDIGANKIAFELFAIQNDFILKELTHYSIANERIALTTMALLDTLNELVTENPELAHQLVIMTSLEEHFLGRNEEDKSVHCTRGTIGAAIAQPIKKRLTQLVEMKITLKHFASNRLTIDSGILLKDDNLENPELFNVTINIYDDKTVSYTEYLQEQLFDNKFIIDTDAEVFTSEFKDTSYIKLPCYIPTLEKISIEPTPVPIDDTTSEIDRTPTEDNTVPYQTIENALTTLDEAISATTDLKEKSTLIPLRTALYQAYHGTLLEYQPSITRELFDKRKQAFVDLCKDAISIAKNSLHKDSPLHNFLYALLSVLVSICTVFIANIVTRTYPHTLFKPPKTSALVQNSIDQCAELCCIFQQTPLA